MSNVVLKASLTTIAACMCLYAGSARAAGSVTSTFTVTAAVQSSCLLSSANIDFGSYNANNSSDLTATGKVSAQCSNGSSYSIALSVPSGGASARALANGSNSLTYQLYKDSARTSVWGDQSNVLTATGSGQQVDHVVYGNVPKNQFVPIGTYTDTVTATVTF
jgi:spore coat protein U-like protein